MTKKNILKGVVAKILNERELVINIGSETGVKKGYCFDVIDPKGEEIRDPETNELLGSLSIKKIRVKVVEVKEKMSIVQTFMKDKVNVGGQGSSLYESVFAAGTLSKMMMPPKWVNRYETLRIDDETLDELEEKNSHVKIGDPVVQVFIDSKDDVKKIEQLS